MGALANCKNVFVVGQVYDEGIKELTLYLADKNPGKKWAIVTQDDDYGLAVREGFGKASKEKKLNVVFSANYKKGQSEEARARLKTMVQTNDGFRIAEEDLRLRGEGEKSRQQCD